MHSPVSIFKAGASLPTQHPLPFKLEDRHKFSPSQADFDEAVKDDRLKFGCNVAFREEIDTVLWLSIADGNPSYSRIFKRDHLYEVNFFWPWMEQKWEEFRNTGIYPKAWSNRKITIEKRLTSEQMFDLWLDTCSQMTRLVREINQMQSLLKHYPDRNFIVRVDDYNRCSLSESSAQRMQSHIPRSLLDARYQDFYPDFPGDSPLIEIGSKRPLSSA